jgi:MFS family permease
MHVNQPPEEKLLRPKPAVAWFGVAALMLATIFSLIDRQVLSLLVEPVRGSLGLSDMQIATLQGPAFMVSFTLLGFPLGWLVDRAHRIRLVAAGIALWSIACASCGLMHSFESLAVARMFVGIGEAVLGPASISLIADYFGPERRPLAMSVQFSAASAGIGIALLAGGSVVALSHSQPTIAVGGLLLIETWRFVFLACGLPGLLVALLVLTAREPPRREDHAATSLGIRFLPFLSQARRWVLPHFGAVSVVAIVGYGFMGWSPAFLMRRHGWSVLEAAFALGLLFVVLGPAGSVFAGWLVRRWRQRGQADAALRVCRASAIGLALSIGGLALSLTAPVVVVLLAVAVFCTTMAPGVSAAALQEATPGAMRGRMAATYYIVTNLVGASLGPLVVAGLTQYAFHEPSQVGLSLATLALCGGPLAAVLLTVALRPYREILAGLGSTASRERT